MNPDVTLMNDEMGTPNHHRALVVVIASELVILTGYVRRELLVFAGEVSCSLTSLQFFGLFIY